MHRHPSDVRPRSSAAASTLSVAVDRVLEWLVVPSYTRLGYLVRERIAHWRPLKSYDLTGRVALVTGATSGIGFATAEALLRMGAHVIVLGRDPQRTEGARDSLAQLTGGSVSSVLAAMDDDRAIRDAAAQVLAAHSRLDILVHNAGALAIEHRRSAMGVEVTSAAQVAGPFLLTGLLLDRLATGDGGRVITVSSGGAYAVPLTVSGLDPGPAAFNGSRQYARAKRAQLSLAALWAERTRDSNVTFHVMHPGWVDTPGLAMSLPHFHAVLKPLSRTARQGADTIAWLAADPAGAEDSGRFWFDRLPRTAHRLPHTRPADTAERRAQLWAWCETTSGWRFPLGATRPQAQA